MKTLYVSGPMTGEPEFNFPVFNAAAKVLRTAGYTVLNPAENWGGAMTIPRALCMRLDIQQVLLADGIATLSGWERSRGARLEVGIAGAVEIPVDTVEAWVKAAC